MIHSLKVLFERLGEFGHRARTFILLWSNPRKCDVLIVFSDSAQEIQRYFPGRTCLVLNVDEGERYVWMLIRSVLRGRRNLEGYITEVAIKSKAQLVISMQDNLSALYRLRQWLPQTPVALVQNGLRSLRGDLLTEIQSSDVANWQIDFYFGFTQQSCDQVGELATKRIPIGSFRSNCTPRSHIAKDQVLSYISTLRTDIPLTTIIGGWADKTPVTYRDILTERLRILREVLHIGQKYGLRPRVLGKGPTHFAEEDFYRKHLPDFDFEFVPRIDISTQYRQVDRSTISVSTSSTLGYESLARGNRTVILQPDAHILRDPSLRFGWPTLTESEGTFWSTSASSQRIQEILYFVNFATDLQWQQAVTQTIGILPDFDPGNTRFVRQLSSWGAQQPHPREEI